MTVRTISVKPAIAWDDGFVFVISFTDANGQQQHVGFVHAQFALASASGLNTQVSKVLQTVNQLQAQLTTDPECWIETAKNAARGGPKITIEYDDNLSVPYTTQTNQSFNLQQLFSMTG